MRGGAVISGVNGVEANAVYYRNGYYKGERALKAVWRHRSVEAPARHERIILHDHREKPAKISKAQAAESASKGNLERECEASGFA